MTNTNTTLTAPEVKYDISQAKLATFLISAKTGKFTLADNEITRIKALANEWSNIVTGIIN
ncbi:MAG: hypothetical protein LBB41_04115 [Prevotellaceae bacterium]|jgi:hypothetical protein|nr:hypothetical protein [Prevotellaceae bacterium]